MSDKNIILSRAKAAVMSRDYILATKLYTELLRETPDDMRILEDLGSLYIKSGKDKKALPIYQQIHMLQPENFTVLLSLGGIYRRLKQYNHSVEVLEKALQTGKNDIQANYSLGFTFKFMGKYDDAIECFESVITENPSDVLAFNHLGVIYTSRKEYEKAVSAFIKGLKTDQNHPVLHLNLAHTYESMKKYLKAAQSYEAALRAKPGWMEAILDYSKLLLKLKKPNKANLLVTQALAIDPKNPKMHAIRGKVYNLNSDYKKSAKEFKQVIDLEPENISALSGLAEAYENSENISEALEVMVFQEKIEPNNISIMKQFSSVLLSAGQIESAGKKISFLLKKYPADLENLDLASQYSILKKNSEKVKSFQKKIKRLDPFYSEFYLNAAKRYHQISSLKEALYNANLYHNLNPTNIKGLLFLAQLEELEENYERALELCEKTFEYDKNNYTAQEITDRIRQRQDTAEQKIQLESSQELLEDGFKLPSPEEIKMNIDDSQFENTEEEAGIEEIEENKKSSSDSILWEDNSLTEDSDEDQLVFTDDENDFEAPIDEELLEGLVETDVPLDDDIENDNELVFSPDVDVQTAEPLLEKSNDSKETTEKSESMTTFPAENESSDQEENFKRPTEDVPTVSDYRENLSSSFQDKDQKQNVSFGENFNDLKKEMDNTLSESKEAIAVAAQEIKDRLDQESEDAEGRKTSILKQLADMSKTLGASIESEKKEQVNKLEKSKGPEEKSSELKNSEQSKESAFVEDSKQTETVDISLVPDGTVVQNIAEKEILQENVKELFDKTEKMLPTIVRLLRDPAAKEKYTSELELFKKLRLMSEYLPPEQKKLFMQSRMRLLLDYLIEKLSGNPGLLATADALRNAGVVNNIVSEKAYNKSFDSHKLITDVLQHMEILASSLPDKDLSIVLNKTADNVLKKLKLVDLKYNLKNI